MQRHKVTRIKRKSKCKKCSACSKDTNIRGQGQDQGQEKIPRPRTEFLRTSALEGRLKPERSRSQILQLFGWSVAYFRKFRNRIGAGVQFINFYSTN